MAAGRLGSGLVSGKCGPKTLARPGLPWLTAGLVWEIWRRVEGETEAVRDREREGETGTGEVERKGRDETEEKGRETGELERQRQKETDREGGGQ